MERREIGFQAFEFMGSCFSVRIKAESPPHNGMIAVSVFHLSYILSPFPDASCSCSWPRNCWFFFFGFVVMELYALRLVKRAIEQRISSLLSLFLSISFWVLFWVLHLGLYIFGLI